MINKAQKLHDALFELEEVKEYVKLKKQLKDDETINYKIKKINTVQLEMKQCLKNDDSTSYVKKQIELEALKKDFYDSPLVINYLSYKHDTLDIIEQIVKILSDE